MVTGGLCLIPSVLAGTAAQQPGIADQESVTIALPELRPGDLGPLTQDLALEALGASGRLPEPVTDTAPPPVPVPTTTAGLEPLTGAGPQASVLPSALGIPSVMLDAYRNATADGACGLTWSVLAGIGRIESGHARGGRVDAKGTTVAPILGPQLAGAPGMAVIRDTDGGRLDGDAQYDRAVGPMQFIPSTWARQAVDGNGDGIVSPHNVFDATKAARNYLCAGGGDLRDRSQLIAAVFRYNHSMTYVQQVLALADAYAAGVTPLPTPPLEAPPATSTTAPPPPDPAALALPPEAQPGQLPEQPVASQAAITGTPEASLTQQPSTSATTPSPTGTTTPGTSTRPTNPGRPTTPTTPATPSVPTWPTPTPTTPTPTTPSPTTAVPSTPPSTGPSTSGIPSSSTPDRPMRPHRPVRPATNTETTTEPEAAE